MLRSTLLASAVTVTMFFSACGTDERTNAASGDSSALTPLADTGATSGSGGGSAAGGTGAELLKAKGCMNCHDRETKKVGPALKDIAAKKPDKSALVAKLRDGKGHMKVAASEAEIGQMVDAVLTMK